MDEKGEWKRMDWKTKLWIAVLGATVIAAVLLILALSGFDITNITIQKGIHLG